MPLFSCFTPFGAGFAFSGAPSHGETIYRSMVSNLGAQTESLSTEEGTRMRAFCYATAMHFARVRYLLEHAGYQLDPLKVCEMLGLREDEYGLVPGPYDSIDDRRAALAAKLLTPKGGWRNNIRNVLQTLLGDAFVQYIPTVFGSAIVTPPNCGDQPMNFFGTSRLPKLVRIVNSVVMGLGSPQWVQYEVEALPFIPEQEFPTLPPQNLLVGEKLVVDPGHNVSHERIEIFGLRELTPGVKELWTIFNQPHAAGALASNFNYPYWLSTKRYNLCVLTADVAGDPETRRKTHEMLGILVRGVSTWSIAQEDPLNPGNTGVFLADTSGSDTQTCENVAIPL